MALLFVVSGPSGVGKTSLVKTLTARRPDIALSVSATTRPPRANEVHGRDYIFLDRAEFLRRRDAGEFLESAAVHGANLYGTPRDQVKACLDAGSPMILEIDVQGARQVKAAMPESVTIFVEPPSWPVLEERLRGRHTEDAAAIERRLGNARLELESAAEFDERLVNDDFASAVDALERIIDGRISGRGPTGAAGPDR